MAIQYPTPLAAEVNEGATARQWMMPGGEYLMDVGTAGGGGGGAGTGGPVMFIVT